MLVAPPELRGAQEANAHFSMRLHSVDEDDGLSLMRWRIVLYGWVFYAVGRESLSQRSRCIARVKITGPEAQ
jgi:hypothetical protein